MESDLSSSDAALRILLVEEVELLESGILASSSASQMRLRARGAARVLLVRAELFTFHSGFPLFMGVICLQFLTSNALIPPLVNQRTGSDYIAQCRACVRVRVLGEGG